MTWASLLLGCSGLVIDVGLENDGLVRSTRLSPGASWRQPPPFSGWMHAGPAGMVAAGAGFLELDAADPPPHALVASATTRPAPSSAASGRRRRPGGRDGAAPW